VSTAVARVTVQAHAKANLFLRVLARETSGYHTLETLFVLLELADRLTVESAESGVELVVEGEDTGPAAENLATRAARLVLEATGHQQGVRIRLEKHIPVKAGLGGGSSDGAAALHAVNALLGNPVPRHEILQLATRLGSDVAFLASGAPLALGWGRGERLFRLRPPSPAAVLVVVPSFGISTADAYRDLDAGRREGSRGAVALDAAAFESWGSIARLGGNDFETVVFAAHPPLRDLFERLAETRPLLVRLSGSGSALVALYKNESDRDHAAGAFDKRQVRLYQTSIRSQPPDSPSLRSG
jgi:4-diphosphocytidyl-2-C-methyl-D-erythritol kinase